MKEDGCQNIERYQLENDKIGGIEYLYKDKISAFDLCEEWACQFGELENLGEEELKGFIPGLTRVGNFDVERVREVLEEVKLKNCNIYISSKIFDF